MNLGIDIHGTLDTIPDVLKPIMRSMVSQGHLVYIITGVPFEYVKDKLDTLGMIRGYNYTHFFSIEEHLLKKGVRIIGKNKKGRNIYRSIDWNITKANYCKKNNIGLMLDDSKIYGRYFSTPYARLQV